MKPAVSQAKNPLSTRYFKLKCGHAVIGAHLHRIHARKSLSCEKGDTPVETVHHAVFESQAWKCQREKLYRALDRARVTRPSAEEDCPEGRLLRESKATAAILEFLATTTHVAHASKATRSWRSKLSEMTSEA